MTPPAIKPKPNKIRGADFWARYQQGLWSERLTLAALNSLPDYFGITYGCSGIAPSTGPEEVNAYFEKLAAADMANTKRPDLLVFNRSDKPLVDNYIKQAGGIKQLPFLSESNPALRGILQKAIMGVECENSMWIVAEMAGYGATLGKARRGLGRQLRVIPHAVTSGNKSRTPHLIVKGEDLPRLEAWQKITGVPIHIWHTFYDKAFGISLNKIRRLIACRWIDPTEQAYERGRIKITFNTPYQFAYQLGQTTTAPEVVSGVMREGAKIRPYAHFSGGQIELEKLISKRLGRLEAQRHKRLRPNVSAKLRTRRGRP